MKKEVKCKDCKLAYQKGDLLYCSKYKDAMIKEYKTKECVYYKPYEDLGGLFNEEN